jgi:hypothetical protein
VPKVSPPRAASQSIVTPGNSLASVKIRCCPSHPGSHVDRDRDVQPTTCASPWRS